MTTKTSGTQHSCEFSEIRSDNYAKDNDDKNADDDENDDNLDKNDLNRLIFGIPLNHTKMTKVIDNTNTDDDKNAGDAENYDNFDKN